MHIATARRAQRRRRVRAPTSHVSSSSTPARGANGDDDVAVVAPVACSSTLASLAEGQREHRAAWLQGFFFFFFRHRCYGWGPHVDSVVRSGGRLRTQPTVWSVNARQCQLEETSKVSLCDAAPSPRERTARRHQRPA
ncbi:hypothetical protein LX36DRAFT_356263 [Colletotrichum falcatum]|nr:hypothetical protein LX36DRAFT_356263 [Colletotrichum falcatum]